MPIEVGDPEMPQKSWDELHAWVDKQKPENRAERRLIERAYLAGYNARNEESKEEVREIGKILRQCAREIEKLAK